MFVYCWFVGEVDDGVWIVWIEVGGDCGGSGGGFGFGFFFG